MSNPVNIVECLEGVNDIAILTHNYPDPDAIGSAWGMCALLRKLGKSVSGIYYSGEISHPQNKAITTLLDINLINYDEHPFDSGVSAVVVDMNGVGDNTNQTHISPDQVDIKLVIDHHKGSHPVGAKVDSRLVGATASIVWEYLSKNGYDFSAEEAKGLATALVVGIFTDTNSLTSDNMANLDFDAYKDLIKKVDKQKLISIMDYPLPPYLFELRQQAYLEGNKRVEESTLVSGLGVVSSSKRDALPIIADEFLRMTGITTSVVFAIVDNHIDISVRSKNITLDVGGFLRKVFGTGGGKQGAGRARIPLGFFEVNGDNEIANDTWELTKKNVMSKVFTNVKGD